LRQLVEAHDAVLYVEVQSDPKKPAGAAYDLRILETVKSHPSLRGVDTLPQSFTTNAKNSVPLKRLIAFGFREEGTWEWGCFIATDDTVQYVKGLVRLKSRRDVLHYAFQFFASADKWIADEAGYEWSLEKDRDVAEAAKTLPPDKVRAVVEDAKADFANRCFACYLLAFSGGKKDAELIARLLADKPDNKAQETHHIRYALRGFVLLDPAPGWKHLESRAKSSDAEFTSLYACLETARFFHENRTGIIPKREIEQLVAEMLEHREVADFVIEDLARWNCWDYSKQVLAITKRKSHQVDVIQRAVLRYAIRCPHEECQNYVKAERLRDPGFVRDTEELMKLEDAPPRQ
jgi:hypothetical protein